MALNNKLKVLFLSFLVLGVSADPSYSDNQFQDFAIQQAGKLLSNPPLFIYEFQRNMETTSPLPPGKKFGLNYHFLGGILIVPLPDLTSAGNLSAKARLHPEGRLVPGLPQIDIVGGYWKSFLTTLVVDKDAKSTDADTKLKDADLDGYYGGFTMASSLEPRVRLFWGYKYSALKLKLDLNKEEDVLGTKVKSFSGSLNEHTLSAGIEHTYGENKRWIFEGGYGVKNNLISAKVSWSRKYVELGLNMYPESVFIMQPQINFHYNF